jgi:hypothetical protein
MQSGYRASVLFILTFSLSVNPLFQHELLIEFLPGGCWLAVFLLGIAGNQQGNSYSIGIH